MEKDGLKKQIFDEVQSQFEAKLREAKRQKTEAEEELETASERWRVERRRLNSEIDRLETALTDAKETPRRKGDSKAGIDPAEVAKIQATAEEKLRNAATEWETERTKLRSQVSRLERAVADTIERSNNPIRSTQPLREHYEARIDDALRQQTEIEQQYLRAKAEWDEDKKKLTGELIKLRRLSPGSKALEAKEKLERSRGRKESIEEARIRDLETRLVEANAEIERYHQAAINAREETRNQFQPRLEEAYRERVKAEDTLAAAAQKWETEKQQLNDQLAQLQQAVVHAKKSSKAQDSDLELEVEELTRAKTSLEAERRHLRSEIEKLERRLAERTDLEEQLTNATKRWDNERGQLQQEIKELQQSKSSTQDKTQAEKELQTQRENWSAERRKLSSEIERLERAAAEAGKSVKQLEADKKALEEERVKQGKEAREALSSEALEKLRKQYEQKLQEVIAQKTKLAAELETTGATLKSERAKFAEEVSKSKTATNGNGKSTNGGLIDAEVTRIEGMIRDITTLIDDPATELSTVIRKNVEKAELDAYLKGILYSLGRGKAMP